MCINQWTPTILTFEEVKGGRSEASIRRPLKRFDGGAIVKLQLEFLPEWPRAVWVSFYHGARFVKNSTSRSSGETVQMNVEPSIFLLIWQNISSYHDRIFLLIMSEYSFLLRKTLWNNKCCSNRFLPREGGGVVENPY